MTIASAAARTFAASTPPPNTFHEFQPIGGVSAIVGPTTSETVRRAEPFAFVAVMTSG